MLSLIATAAICNLFTAAHNAPEMGTYTVISCHDGDTCKIVGNDNASLRIRLAGIDAPEVGGRGKGQPFGDNSKDFINQLIKGKTVQVRFLGEDAFQRNLAEFFMGSLNVNIEILKGGMAEVYRGKGKSVVDMTEYLEAEKQAKDQKRGVWELGAAYISPAEHRKKNRN